MAAKGVLDGDVVTRFDNDLVIRYVDKVIIEPNGYEVYTDNGFAKHIAESRWGGDGLVPSLETLDDRVLLPDAISPCDGHKLNIF